MGGEHNGSLGPSQTPPPPIHPPPPSQIQLCVERLEREMGRNLGHDATFL